MRTPIAQALAYPERIDAGVAPLDLAAAGRALVRGARLRALSLPRGSPIEALRRRGHRAGACSTPPTRSPSRPSSPARIALHRHRRRLRRERSRALPARAAAHARRRARGRRRGPRVRPRVARAAGRRRADQVARIDRLMDILQKVLAFLVVLSRARGDPRAGPLLASRAGAGSRCCASRSASAASLWSRRFGPDRTEWAISAVPLGGYVKMRRRARGRASRRATCRARSTGRAWASASRSSRAGPIANLLLAVLLFAGTFVAGVPGQRAVLADPPAGHAGRARAGSAPATASSPSTARRCRAGRTCAGGCSRPRAQRETRSRSSARPTGAATSPRRWRCRWRRSR